MDRKDILELRRRFNKEENSLTRIAGCLVSKDKDILLKFNESFLSLEEDDYFKYIDIAKKLLSGSINNNLLKLDFEDTSPGSTRQNSLNSLRKSKLKDDNLLDSFFKDIVSKLDFEDSYLILVFHDIYDLIKKTSDNLKLDESEDVFEYILVGICPVTLSDPSLSYIREENVIKSRPRDWLINPPINGFLYPAFVNRGPDIHSLVFYTKNTKSLNLSLVEDILLCKPLDTKTMQKNKFQTLIDEVGGEEDQDLYLKVQDSLNLKVVEYQENFGDASLRLDKESLVDILGDNGIDEDHLDNIEDLYQDNFNNQLPVLEDLIDKKALKINEQKKIEKALENQVEFLKEKLSDLEVKDDQVILKLSKAKLKSLETKLIGTKEYILLAVDENLKTIVEE